MSDLKNHLGIPFPTIGTVDRTPADAPENGGIVNVSAVNALDTDVDLSIARSLDVPHLDQFLGVWAMQEEAVGILSSQVSAMDLAAHITAARTRATVVQAQPRSATPGPLFSVEADGIAVIDLTGMMTKFGSSLSRLEGGTLGVRKALRTANNDPAITGIVLRIDSPGGTVAGTVDLADDVERIVAAGGKPVNAFIEDLAASAAFWVASQASTVVVNRNAVVGSIGVYAVLRDTSKAAEKAGVVVHIVRSGEFKGAGAPGTEVTDAQLAAFRTTVNQINDLFIKAVADGRKLPVAQVRELADGRVHVGANAVELGLANRVGTFEGTLAAIREQTAARRGSGLPRARHMVEIPASWANIHNEENEPMAGEPNGANTVTAAPPTAEPRAATLKQLQTALPNADAAFLVDAATKDLTVAQAKDAWIEQLDKKLATSYAAAEQLAKAAPGKPIGNKPLTGNPRRYDQPEDREGETAADFGDPRATYVAKVKERMADGLSRMDACDAVTRAEPALHKAYLLACNPGRAQQRKIEDKYEVVGNLGEDIASRLSDVGYGQ